MLAPLADRFYRVRWQEADLPGLEAAATTGRWLVVPVGPDDHQAASALASVLIEAGAADARVDVATEDPGRLLDDGFAGVALVATGEPGGTSVVEAALTVGRAFALASAAPRLWLVTRGAQDPDANAVLVPDRAAAWRMLRILAMESGLAWGGCVDVDTGDDYAAVAAAMISRDHAVPVEDELVRRDGRWYVPRLVRAQVPAALPPTPRCQPAGRYLLVGSAVPYGEVIERLVAAGARRWMVVRPGAGHRGRRKGLG